MMAARAVVFGQASAFVAALVAGTYGGTGVFLLLNDLDLAARREQALYAGLSVLTGVAVVAAAVFLSGCADSPRTTTTPRGRRRRSGARARRTT